MAATLMGSCHDKTALDDEKIAISFGISDENDSSDTNNGLGPSRSMMNSGNALQEACVYSAASDEYITINGYASTDGQRYLTFIDNAHLHYNPDKLCWQTHTLSTTHAPCSYYYIPRANHRFWLSYPGAKVAPLLSLNSNALDFTLTYDSHSLQDDIMLGYTSVDTRLDNIDFTQPIPVVMTHTLAALRISFEYAFDDHDLLTGCWLENATSGGIITKGSLNTSTDGSTLTHVWSNTLSPATNIYHWQLANPDTGIPFSQSTDAHGNVTNIIATAYTTPVGYTWDDANDTGKNFIHNDGWIYLIPQTIHPNSATLCFTSWNNGIEVMRVQLPASLGTLNTIDGSRQLLAGHHYQLNIKVVRSPYSPNLQFVADAWEVIENYMEIN